VDVETQQDASTIENTRIAAVGDRIALCSSARQLYYSVQSAGGWSPLRSIVLDGITEEQAEILVRNASAIRADALTRLSGMEARVAGCRRPCAG